MVKIMSDITADTLSKTDRQTVNLLFTGGWDSTFRLLQLSEYPIIVQPIYIVEYFRASAKHEQRTMRKIIEAVRKRDSCHAVINNPIIYDGEWVLKNCADDEKITVDIVKETLRECTLIPVSAVDAEGNAWFVKNGRAYCEAVEILWLGDHKAVTTDEWEERQIVLNPEGLTEGCRVKEAKAK